MTNRELLSVVRAARMLVSDPAKWNRRNYAEDESGRWVPVGSDRAVTFNLMGALVRAAGASNRHALGPILQAFADTSPQFWGQWTRDPLRPLTREQALMMLDRAIAHLSLAAEGTFERRAGE